MAHAETNNAQAPRVGLFATCLVDLFRPSVGFAAVELLQGVGCAVEVPAEQTCCGQPAYNSGDPATARHLAKRVIEQFAGYDYVVLPSGSCAAMIRVHYPRLFAGDAEWEPRARELAGRCHELVSFLTDVRRLTDVSTHFGGRLAYHDSCSGLRELGIREQPRALLAGIAGLDLAELADPDTCCGFGGTFCVKYPAVSARLVRDKAADIEATGAVALAGGDLGCLLNIAGWLKRGGSAVRCYHIAEVLAGMTDAPGIGDPETSP